MNGWIKMVRDPGQVSLSIRHLQRDLVWGEVFNHPERAVGVSNPGREKGDLFSLHTGASQDRERGGVCVSGSGYRITTGHWVVSASSRLPGKG